MLGCYCCYYGKGKGIGWYVQVKVGKAVDQDCKNACHGAKGEPIFLAALGFKILKAGFEKREQGEYQYQDEQDSCFKNKMQVIVVCIAR